MADDASLGQGTTEPKAARKLQSRAVQVAAAVAIELREGGRWPPNDRTRTLGADYNYNLNTMGNLLSDVRDRLAEGTPPYQLDF